MLISLILTEEVHDIEVNVRKPTFCYYLITLLLFYSNKANKMLYFLNIFSINTFL